MWINHIYSGYTTNFINCGKMQNRQVEGIGVQKWRHVNKCHLCLRSYEWLLSFNCRYIKRYIVYFRRNVYCWSPAQRFESTGCHLIQVHIVSYQNTVWSICLLSLESLFTRRSDDNNANLNGGRCTDVDQDKHINIMTVTKHPGFVYHTIGK